MAFPRLISISGSVHSGKTTISRMLAAKMPNAFYVDGDLISSWVGQAYSRDTTIDDMLPDIHSKIIEFIKPALRDGNDTIVDYPFSDKVRGQILEELRPIEFESKWFLLKPDIEKVLTGSGARPRLNDWEKARINYHYNESNLLDTSIAKVIDSTNQTPEETLNEVIGELGI